MGERRYNFVVGICDDDSAYRDYFVDLVRRIGTEESRKIKIVAFSSGEEAVNFCGDLDILFLDEELADGEERKLNGCQVREIFAQRCSKTFIICITSYTQYMQSSFGHNVMGFITKGSDDEGNQVAELLIRCIDTIETQSNVAYIESYKHELEIHLFNGDHYTMRGSIESLCKGKTDSEIFVRCHKSYVVNLNYVSAMKGNFKSFIINNNQEIPIGRTKREETKSKYNRLKEYKAGLLFGRED